MSPPERTTTTLKADASMPNFVAAMMAGCTIEEASKQCGVSKSTGCRWIKSPRFREQLDTAQRQLFGAIGRKAFSTARPMLEVLEGIALSPETDPRARVSAAKASLDCMLKCQALDVEARLEAKIQALEERLYAREMATEDEEAR